MNISKISLNTPTFKGLWGKTEETSGSSSITFTTDYHPFNCESQDAIDAAKKKHTHTKPLGRRHSLTKDGEAIYFYNYYEVKVKPKLGFTGAEYKLYEKNSDKLPDDRFGAIARTIEKSNLAAEYPPEITKTPSYRGA